MSAFIFSFFQPAVSGLLMQSFTANGIQTAERQRHRERERDSCSVDLHLICSANKDRNTIWGWRLTFWYFPGIYSKICFLFPEKGYLRDPCMCVCACVRVCVCVHTLKTIICCKACPKLSEASMYGVVKLSNLKKTYRETTASTPELQLFLSVSSSSCRTSTGDNRAPRVYSQYEKLSFNNKNELCTSSETSKAFNQSNFFLLILRCELTGCVAFTDHPAGSKSAVCSSLTSASHVQICCCLMTSSPSSGRTSVFIREQSSSYKVTTNKQQHPQRWWWGGGGCDLFLWTWFTAAQQHVWTKHQMINYMFV